MTLRFLDNESDIYWMVIILVYYVLARATCSLVLYIIMTEMLVRFVQTDNKLHIRAVCMVLCELRT